MSVKILERDGRPAFAILPIEEYHRLLEALEDARDAATIEEFYDRLVAGEEETLPIAVMDRILDGENPVAVLRECRGLTLRSLANACGVTGSHISQIEKGKRSMSTEVLKRMSHALRADIELLI